MKVYVVPENNSFGAKLKAWCINRKRDLDAAREEHPMIFWTVVLTLASGGIDLIKLGIRSHNLKMEDALKTLRCYDRKGGHYWELIRPVSNSEWLEIKDRMANGEQLGDLLKEIGALK